jgi:RND family efflux transporter MFP subunit
MNDVDLTELAIDRDDGGGLRPGTRGHLLTRYVLPGCLVIGVAILITWAAWDVLIPAKMVTVVPVFSTQAEVQIEGTPLFKAAGWVEPRPTPVRVAALAVGVVQELKVVEDQLVTQGQPVAELIKDDAQLAHQRALADLKLRQAERDEAGAALTAATTRLEQPVHLTAALGEAEALLAKGETLLQNLPFELRRAKAEARVLRIDLDSKQEAKGVVAGVVLDRARSAFESGQALVDELMDRGAFLKNEQVALSHRRDALKTQLELLVDEIKSKHEAEARVKAATARIEQADVAVAETRLRLDRMTVRAPIDGRVFRLIGHPGASIGRGMTQMAGHDGSTIVTLYRPDMLQVRVDVRFEDIPQVSLGQPVQIENPALKSPLKARVLFVSSEADIQKNTLQVKVEIPEPPTVFKPEMLVDVTFLAPRPTRQPQTDRQTALRLFLPQELIHQDEQQSFVWLADQAAGVARKIRVETGRAAANGLVQVTSGLTVASRVIDRGSVDLAEGDRIRVVEGAAGATQDTDVPTN